MEEEAQTLQPGAWHFVWKNSIPAILDQRDNLVATIGPSSNEKMLARASLIMAAPDLYDMLTAVLDIFQVMAEQGDDRYAVLARDMLPHIQDAIDHANFLVPITSEALVGQ